MEQQKETQLVYIKDLLFTVLYRWKTVLIGMLVFALLLGGASMLLTGNPSLEDQQALTNYNTTKAVYDQRIAALEKSIAERKNYTENALLMVLDPYHHYEAQLTVSVQLQTTGDGLQAAFSSQSLLEAYRTALTDEAGLEKFAEILQQPAQYVPELMGATDPAIGTDTVTFTIKCADAQTAAALAEAMETHLVQYWEKIGQDLQPHTLAVLKRTALAVSDSSLAETQRGELNRLSEILAGLTETRNKRNALTLPEVADASSKGKTAILLAIVGAFAGAFVMVCVLWIGHIGSGKVYSGRTLQNRTGIKLLGTLDSGKKRCGIQKWLRKLEGRTTVADPTYVATEIALRTNAAKLLVTGSDTLAEALKKAMSQTEITAASSLLESAEALQALADCDFVVLVETCGSSRYQDILQEMEKINDFNKQLMGCVLVDG